MWTRVSIGQGGQANVQRRRVQDVVDPFLRIGTAVTCRNRILIDTAGRPRRTVQTDMEMKIMPGPGAYLVKPASVAGRIGAHFDLCTGKHENAGNTGTVDDILAELFGNPILAHGAVS